MKLLQLRSQNFKKSILFNFTIHYSNNPQTFFTNNQKKHDVLITSQFSQSQNKITILNKI